jgi:hypothetical protein
MQVTKNPHKISYKISFIEQQHLVAGVWRNPFIYMQNYIPLWPIQGITKHPGITSL